MKFLIVLAAVLAVAKPQGLWGNFHYMDNTQGVPTTGSCTMGTTGWVAGIPCIIPVIPGPNPRPPTTVEPNPACPQLHWSLGLAEKRFPCFEPLYQSSHPQAGPYPVPVVAPGRGVHYPPSWGYYGGQTWGGNTMGQGWGM